ncbi:MAG: helix-turn-helix domain-containing protein [Sandaracinobacter sp.]
MTIQVHRGDDPRFFDGRGSGCSLFDRPMPTLTARGIASLTAAMAGQPLQDILGPYRAHDCVRARFAAIWVVRQALPLSLPQIGRAFGGRDHTTIISALRRAEELRSRDRAFWMFTEHLLAAARALASGAVGGADHAG